MKLRPLSTEAGSLVSYKVFWCH